MRPVRAMLLRLFVGLCLLLLAAQSHGQSPNLSERLPEEQELVFEWLDDPGEPMSLQQVINRGNHEAFTKLSRPLGRGYTLSNSWLRLRITERQRQYYRYLWMFPSQLDNVDVYYQVGLDRQNAGHYQHKAFGDHVADTEKSFIHFRMLFPLADVGVDPLTQSFTPQANYTLYIRIRTISSHAFNASLVTEDAMISRSSLYLFFYAGFIAIAVMLSTFSLFVALRLKDRIYFWYAAYLLSVVCAYLPITGTFFIIFPRASSYLSDLLTGAGTGLGFLCFSMLCSHLLQQSDQDKGWLYYYLRFTVLVGAVQAVTSVSDLYVYTASVAAINGVLFALVLLINFAGRLASERLSDRFIFLALFLTVIGIFVNFIRLMGWVPENAYSIHAFQFASLLHMLCLHQAFAERVMYAERQAVEVARRSEQEAIAMSGEMNKELLQALENEQGTRRDQERFIDMISHEYRTPLSILKTNLEILELKEKVDWTGRHNLTVMLQAAERLQEVFDKSIKGSSWKQAMQQNCEQIELVALFEHFMDEGHLMWNNISLHYDVQVTHAWYKALDPALMKTVVFNLIDNARKYSSDRHDIQVSLRVASDRSGLIFSVSNPVEGSVGRQGSELTQRYVRGGNSVGTSGLGMGLSLAEQIIHQLGDQLILKEQSGRFDAVVMLQADAKPDEALSPFDGA